MRSKLTTLSLIALLSVVSAPVIATDDGTWHDGGGQNKASSSSSSSSSFCESIGAIAGEGMQDFCSALFK